MEASVVHRVFRNDPLNLKSFYQKYVVVKTVDGCIHEGWVNTIDPVSDSIVLARLSETGDPQELEVILGHAVTSINIVPNEEFLYNPRSLNRLIYNAQGDDRERKHKIKRWMAKHHIPVREYEDALTIAGAVTLMPPYTPENCVCTNEIILGKIQDLISTMPDDANEDVS